MGEARNVGLNGVRRNVGDEIPRGASEDMWECMG